ncbi:SulP family sulfate permease [Piedraia hortae CBS 480.64]|uniref:SulP family sulfate permease n=1 Tax=Piedraia hortae CBS 480.64 TaxID=1314780 RepID=A0A6A7BTN7_9PEZI|nr:SulP family sulfate permease [Piedraia hortae CBS 480.64]
MSSKRTQIGHGLAKGLGIRLGEAGSDESKLSRGESVFSVGSADDYIEGEPTTAEWIRSITPSGRQCLRYFHDLFPFTRWLPRYNLQWLAGDLVAGITIGAVVVPQGMAYAELAALPVEYGLYSSFMGVLIYWFFATSKDITIGPVAVMSTVVGNIVTHAHKSNPDIPGHVIASSLSLVAGAIVCFFGLMRLGWLVEFISLASICAYMTGSAISIIAGQVPTMMGLSGFSTRGPAYRVIINTLKHLPETKLDAALGLTCLVALYGIRFIFNQLARRQPERKKLWFFCNTLRTVFVILLYTLVSWLANRHLPKHNSKKAPFKILGHVPRGFQHAGVPRLDSTVFRLYSSELPASVIVLLIEHISIAKSFGRVNNYTINPSQELVAIGVANILGPFLGGYPSTGSFSRTAIKSKAGVRTPFAGVITAVVVLLAIYALPAMFFYIPSAALAGVIIHAVGDLITPPNTVYQFWRVSPIEVLIFFAGVLVVVFSTIEYGVYTTICTSVALLMYRVFKARGHFLGRVKVRSVIGGPNADDKYASHEKDSEQSTRNVFLPIDHDDGSNPEVVAEHPYPGIFIYRFSEGYNFPNASHYLEYMVQTIFELTRRTNPTSYSRPGDRPWNDPGPRRSQELMVEDDRPKLRAVILDFSSVNNVDITSVQLLIDVRNQLDRYTAPERVQWHFACINNRWTKRALAAAGFGYPSMEDPAGFHRWKPIYSVAEIGGDSSAAAAAEDAENRRSSQIPRKDEESGDFIHPTDWNPTNRKVAVIQSVNRPFFHVDLTSALQSAIQDAKDQDRYARDRKDIEEGSS